MKKRIITLALAFLMIIPVLTACTGETGKDKNEDTANTTTTTAVTDVETSYASGVSKEVRDDILNKSKYPDTEFVVLNFDSPAKHGWTDIPNDISVEGEKGEWLNDAVFARNNMLEELTGVTIVCENAPNNAVTETLKADIDAQYNRYGAVNQTLSYVNQLYTKNYITDMNALGINYDYDWWDKNCIETLTIGSKLVAACSDITYMDKLSTVSVFFNKTMVKNFDMPDMYELTTSNQWTYSKMLEYTEAACEDNDPVGKYGTEDSYLISCQNDGSYFFLNAAGLTTVTKDNNGRPSFTANTDPCLSTLQEIYTLMSKKDVYFNRQLMSPVTDLTTIAGMFAANRTLFLVRPLQTLYDLKSQTEEFGIIPMPKYTAGQEYCSPINFYGATVLCIPINVVDSEKTVNVLQAWGMLSKEYVMPKLYDTVLGAKLINDQIAAEMLDIIFGNRIYDLGLIWNFAGISTLIVTKSYSSYPTTLKSKLDIKAPLVEDEIKTLLGE